MKVVEKRIYKFSKLKKDIQEKVIDDYYKNYEYFFLEEELNLKLKELDVYKVFDNPKIFYSLPYCPGYSLNFVSYITMDNFLKEYNIKESLFDLICNSGKVSFYFVNRSHNYPFHRGEIITTNFYFRRSYRRIERFIKKVLEDLQDYYYEICSKTEKYGLSILEYRMSIEEFSKFSDYNMFKYYENGRIYT